MGVQGITPFLQKFFPDVLKLFPNRLEALRGKTIVIDGTLITQRFHYIENESPHQHVARWYNLARQLRTHEVNTICVFDGKQRSEAKANESRRRRRVMELSRTRGSLEEERFARLRSLNEHLVRLRNAAGQIRNQIGDRLAASADDTSSKISMDHQMGELARINAQTSQKGPAPQGTEVVIPSVSTPEAAVAAPEKSDMNMGTIVDQLDLLHLNYKATTAMLASIPTVERASRKGLTDHQQDERIQLMAQIPIEVPLTEVPAPQEAELMIPVVPTSEATTPEKAEMNMEQLAERLNDLYLNYKATTAMLASFPTLEGAVVEIPDGTIQAMTKTQYDLTCEEGKLWEYVANVQKSLASDDYDVPQQDLDNLLDRSYAMTTSFRRRNNTPTSKTYSESKEILQAMGVICIDATGAIEGEALASSIVLSGHADYVATEDTDVLAYGAPMIRNLTGHEDPLIVISGAEVRNTLELDHAAYLDFILLLGTDFSQRIKNLGPVKALSLIKEHGSIEGVLESIANQPRYALKLPREAYLAQVNTARDVFRTLPPPPPLESLTRLEADEDRAKQILAEYSVERYAVEEFIESQALAGNLFSDNPSTG